eukprot:1945041-Prymnesium_polylepis.1
MPRAPPCSRRAAHAKRRALQSSARRRWSACSRIASSSAASSNTARCAASSCRLRGMRRGGRQHAPEGRAGHVRPAGSSVARRAAGAPHWVWRARGGRP